MYLFCFSSRLLYEVVCTSFHEFPEIVELIDGAGKFLYSSETFPKLLLLWLRTEGRTILAVSACKGTGAAVATAVRTSSGTNGGYSRWFPAATFLPVAGVDDENKSPFFLSCSIYNDLKVNCI